MLLRKGEYKMPVGKQTAPAGGTIGFCLERWGCGNAMGFGAYVFKTGILYSHCAWDPEGAAHSAS